MTVAGPLDTTTATTTTGVPTTHDNDSRGTKMAHNAGSDPVALAAVTERIRPLADALALDGGLLSVERIDGPVLQVRLELAPDACQDCIVPDPIIEQMVLDTLTDLPAPRPERVEVAHGPTS